MAIELFDSHTHLNDRPFANQEADYVQRAAVLGVNKMAIVGSNTELNQGAITLAHRFKSLYAIIGWHPEDAKDYTPAAAAKLREQLSTEDKVVAIGEIGLDYHWNTTPKDVQKRVFAEQLALAKSLHYPVSIHTRDALADTYQLLKAAALPAGQIIMHSFNAPPEWVGKYLDLGAYLSFSGVITFKNTAYLRESLKQVPLDRLLVETDAPYLTPVPHRGQQNQPGFARYVAAGIAQTLQLPLETIADKTYQNACRVFNLVSAHD